LLEALLSTIVGFVGGFVSTLASNGSAITLPALEFFGLSEHVANGTNRLSVVALGFAGTVGFYRQGLINWREGTRIAAFIAAGTIVGSFVAVELSDAILDAIVITGLLLVLGLLLVRPRRWIGGREGALRPFDLRQAAAYFAIGVYAGLVVLGSGFFMLATLVLLTGSDLRQGNALKAFILLVVGMQSLLIFADTREVEWVLGIPLAMGSAAGAYVATRLASIEGAKVWVYRLLVLLVIVEIIHLIMVDDRAFLQHT
jgi:uncharacterized membrane protein YfcA